MLSDRAFDRRNQLTDPFSAKAHAPNDGVKGRYVLVNGAHLPVHRVSATRHRLRILNASNFRSYNLGSTRGQLVQIATESGLIPAPRHPQAGPDRAWGAGRADRRLQRRRRASGSSSQRPPSRSRRPRLERPTDGPLMQFRVGGAGARRERCARRTAPATGLGRLRSDDAPAALEVHHRRRPASRSGWSTARPSTPRVRTPSRCSGRPRRGSCTTRPRSRTRSTCTTPTGTWSRATASRRRPGSGA